MSDCCQGCGRTDMAGITHVCPPLPYVAAKCARCGSDIPMRGSHFCPSMPWGSTAPLPLQVFTAVGGSA